MNVALEDHMLEWADNVARITGTGRFAGGHMPGRCRRRPNPIHSHDASHSETPQGAPFYGRHPWVLTRPSTGSKATPPTGMWWIWSPTRANSSPAASSTASSRIRVRLYTWDAAESLDETFLRRRLESAIRFRGATGYDDPQGRRAWSSAKAMA